MLIAVARDGNVPLRRTGLAQNAADASLRHARDVQLVLHVHHDAPSSARGSRLSRVVVGLLQDLLVQGQVRDGLLQW